MVGVNKNKEEFIRSVRCRQLWKMSGAAARTGSLEEKGEKEVHI